MPYEWLPPDGGEDRLHLWPHRSLTQAGFVWFVGLTAALIAVPLRAGRRLLGAMAVLHDGPRAWTQGEAFLVELVAERAWAAVERARVEVEARRVREERDRLEREFVANAAHELRSPLAAIAAAVDALVLGAKDDPVLRERFIGHLGREAERLTRLTQSLLLLARIAGGQVVPVRKPLRGGGRRPTLRAGDVLEFGLPPEATIVVRP